MKILYFKEVSINSFPLNGFHKTQLMNIQIETVMRVKILIYATMCTHNDM